MNEEELKRFRKLIDMMLVQVIKDSGIYSHVDMRMISLHIARIADGVIHAEKQVLGLTSNKYEGGIEPKK